MYCHNNDTKGVAGVTVLTVVVVEKVGGKNNPSTYRLACKEGPIKGLYHRSYLTPLPEATKELMGLDTIFTTWKGKAALTVLEVVSAGREGSGAAMFLPG